MVTNAGGGYSRWRDLAVTRWREDGTRDDWGTFCYLRDVDSGEVWSTAQQPTLAPGGGYEAIFAEPRASSAGATTRSTRTPRSRSRRRTTSSCAACASPTARARAGRSRSPATPKSCSAPAAADAVHPAFSNLFVQTEIVARATGDPVHAPAARGRRAAAVDAAPDGGARRRQRRRRRTRPIARASSAAAAASPTRRRMREPAPLSGHAGLGARSDRRDPAPRRARAGADRRPIDHGHRRRREPRGGARAGREIPGPAPRRSRVRAGLDAQPGGAAADQRHRGRRAALRAAGRPRASTPTRRCAPTPAVIASNRRGQSGLWGYAISGDLPIVLLRIGDAANIELVRQLVQAHAYWRLKGLAVDLVIWNEDRGGYRQVLQDQIIGLIAAGGEAQSDRPAGRHLRAAGRADRAGGSHPAADGGARDRHRCARRARRAGRAPRSASKLPIPRFSADAQRRRGRRARRRSCRARDLILGNGLGGFTADGREYVITHAARRDDAGAVGQRARQSASSARVVSESGSGLHLVRERARIPPDAVAQRSGQRSDAARRSTCATRRADASGRRRRCRRGEAPYTTRHGFGYSVFEHAEDGIRTELWIYVAIDAPVKFSRAQAAQPVRAARAGSRSPATSNGCSATCARKRRCTSSPRSIPNSGALFARNAYNTEFAERVAFLDVDEPTRTVTGDRSEFIGRNGSLAQARGDAARAAVGQGRRRRSIRAPRCRCRSSSADGESARGRLPSRRRPRRRRREQPRAALPRPARRAPRSRRCASTGSARSARSRCRRRTPALNVLANGWLLYQTIACRLWGRSGFYQSGGAFGFRDQLQDAMALVHAEPALLREQLLRCAARQFPRRRRPALVASAARPRRAHALLRRLPVAAAGRRAATSPRTGDTGVLDENVRVPRRPPGRRRRGHLLRPAGAVGRERRRSTSTACARSSTACASARTACR